MSCSKKLSIIIIYEACTLESNGVSAFVPFYGGYMRRRLLGSYEGCNNRAVRYQVTEIVDLILIINKLNSYCFCMREISFFCVLYLFR